MDIILRESPDVIDEYMTSQVLQFDSSASGLQVTFAVYVEFNSTTQPHEIEIVVRNFLNRLITTTTTAATATSLLSISFNLPFSELLLVRLKLF